MSEIPLPEPGPLHSEAPKKHGHQRLVEPLLSSVPTLIGVLVGAVTSHFAEVQKFDFEREDRFRHEQVERVATVAHGYDSLAKPLIMMITGVETQQPALCKDMAQASAAEIRLRDRGLLHGRLFSPGPVDPYGTADYGRQIDALAATTDQGVSADAARLKAMIGSYTTVLAGVEAGYSDFLQKREAFQGTLMFEVKVYFPKKVRKDIVKTVDDYYEIGKQTASVQAPNQLCTLNIADLSNRLIALDVRSARAMIDFAQSLEPELDDSVPNGKT
jgi:hypothetical protein